MCWALVSVSSGAQQAYKVGLSTVPTLQMRKQEVHGPKARSE